MPTMATRRAGGGRTWRRGAAVALVMGLAATACGGDDGGDATAEATTTSAAEASTTAPTTTAAAVSWADPDDIFDNSPDQVLPTLAELIALIDGANAELGATDSLGYDEEDQARRVAIETGPCSQIAFATFFYDSTVGLTETPSVGVLAPGMTASVCDDEAAAAERAEFWYGLVDLDQGPCPVDDRDESGFGLLVCPRQPGEELRWWSVAAVGMVDRVLFWVSADLGPATDPVEGGASIQAMLDALIAHVDERLA